MILEVTWDGLWTLSSGLSQCYGHGSWLVCEVARISWWWNRRQFRYLHFYTARCHCIIFAPSKLLLNPGQNKRDFDGFHYNTRISIRDTAYNIVYIHFNLQWCAFVPEFWALVLVQIYFGTTLGPSHS
jgi:hypothetical protein